jgi:hypothetical protein
MIVVSLRKPVKPAVSSIPSKSVKPHSAGLVAPKPVKPISKPEKGEPRSTMGRTKLAKIIPKQVKLAPKLAKSKGNRVRRRGGARKRRYDQRRKATTNLPMEKKQAETPNARSSYDQGYQEGLIAGGERILEEHLPSDLIIPDLTFREVVAAGVQVLKTRGIPLLDSNGVYRELEEALRGKKSYAFIRLGDGELLTLAQEKVLSLEEIRRAGHFLPYAGVKIPNLEARDELATCVKVASLIGVPMSRSSYFQPLLFAVLRAHGIEYEKLRYTTSTMNYLLEEQGLLLQLLRGRKALVIGDVAAQLSEALIMQGVEVTGVITPVNGYTDYPRVVAEANAYDYDIALVAAGIAAIPIAVHLAGVGGKVTFDFGHLANRMAGLSHPERNDTTP